MRIASFSHRLSIRIILRRISPSLDCAARVTTVRRGHNLRPRPPDCGPAGTAGEDDVQNPVTRISHPHANLTIDVIRKYSRN